MYLQLRLHRLVTLLLGLLTLGGCAERPNVILITLDTFRADRIGTYGHPGELTPALDELAAASTVFENAITPIGTTFPAHASMFTGLYPGDHGVRWNGDVLKQEYDTVAELLRNAGYATAAFVSVESMLTSGGLDQGFQVVNDRPSSQPGVLSGLAVNAQARRWLKYAGDEPIFLWLHYYETHSPYRLTGYAQHRLGDYMGPLKGGASTKLFYSYGSEELRPTAENERALNVLYDGEVMAVDSLVGNILNTLRMARFLDNAWVIVVADHGQLLGEHDVVGHGFHVWEPVLKVPFIVWQSGEPAAGRRIKTRVSLVDLAPTVLDVVGVKHPANLAGRSLSLALRGEDLPDVDHFGSVRVPDPNTQRLDRKSVAVYHESYKYVLSGEKEFTFDLKTDPGETDPLGVSELDPHLLDRLRPQALAHRTRERSDRIEALSADRIKELRTLGYIQ